LDIEVKEYNKTKDSRHEMHEKHSKIQFRRLKVDTFGNKLPQ